MAHSELEYIERTSQLPFQCRIVSIENSSLHWHHEYEMLFVLRGSVNIYAEEAHWLLEAGDLYLFNAGEIHSISMATHNNLCLILQFRCDIFSDIYKSSFHFDLNTKSQYGLPQEGSTKIRRDLAQIGLLLDTKPNGYQFFIKSHLYHFIGALFQYSRYQVGNTLTTPDKERLQDFNSIKKYIKERFHDEITIPQMCKDLGLSRAKIYRILRDAGTDSYKSLVNYYRVEHAKGLLRNSDSPIQYIATISGFDSDSSFYRVFKTMTTLSPSQYREQPLPTNASVGIQGYVSYSKSEATEVLRQFL